MNTTVVDRVFREGEEVVLAEGTYQGTPGVFLRLRADARWADIRERNGSVRSHPVEWLAHAPQDGNSRQGGPTTPPESAHERRLLDYTRMEPNRSSPAMLSVNASRQQSALPRVSSLPR